MKELRIDFPDYPPKEQEMDAMRARFKQVYLMKIQGKWVHYTLIDRKEDYDIHNEDLTQTYYEIKAKFRDYTVKVIQNDGLENYLKDMLFKKKIDNLQLKINFKGGR